MKFGSVRRVPESVCLNCGHLLDGANGVGEDAHPSPGDVTMCIRCGHIMAFGDDLRLREMNDAEARKVAGDERLLVASRAIAAAWAKLGK